MVRPTRRHDRIRLAVGTLLCVIACVDTPPRPGATSEPSGPSPSLDIVGDYSAVQLIAVRSGQVDDLLTDDDTRIDLRLNSDGTAFGQVKIGADPDLRTKQPLLGTWRLSPPAQVTFEFTPSNFMEDIVFRAQPPLLTGDWMSESGVRLHIELRRID